MRSSFPRIVSLSTSVFLVPTRSSPTPALTVVSSKPNPWTHSLQIHCNGSAGPRSHPSMGPSLKITTLQLVPFMGRKLVRWWVQRFVRVGSSLHQQESPMRGYGSQFTIPYGENYQMVYSSIGLWHHVHGPCLHQGSDPREPSGRPRWVPIEGKGSHAERF